ncbi:hypothetical protein VDG1235_1332 [Verrucomicrobiia bacterium DG1235]|nr:hypothetical protein VDG1235_1332 [Verrucomicrobiae bacterium DG1235]
MKQSSLSLRVLKLVLTVCWWGSVIMAVLVPLALVYAASSSGNPKSDWEFSYTGYASGIDTSSLSAVDRDGREGRVEFNEGTWVQVFYPIETSAGRVKLVLLIAVVSGVVLAFFLVFIKQLKDILDTVSEGDPFVEVNAGRVRLIGVLLIVGTFGQALLRLVVSGYADSSLRTTGFQLDGNFEMNFMQLIAGVSVLVLSEVFRLGTKMREEQELTV